MNALIETTSLPQLSKQGIIVVFIGALYFFLDSMLAVFPAAMTRQLMDQFHVTALSIGFFAAFYFYAYAPLQLPCGSLLDKYGPKCIMLGGCLLCSAALVLFAYAKIFWISCLARGLMGIGAAAGYLAPMLLVVNWFPHRYYVIMTGFIVLIECVGAVCGSPFIIYLSHAYSQTSIILMMASFGVVLFFLIIFIVFDQPTVNTSFRVDSTSSSINMTDLRRVVTNRGNWVIAIIAALFWAPVAVFASLWGIPFLQTVYHYSASTSANLLILFWAGLGLSCPLWGWFSNLINSLNKTIFFAAILGLISAFNLVLNTHLNSIALVISLFCMGAACAGQTLTFGLLHERHSYRSKATAFGFNNTVICFGNAFFQFLSGILLDIFWHGKFDEKMKIYSSVDFQQVLIILPLGFMLILIFNLFLMKSSKALKENLCH